jgi:hypothetical protein
MTVCKGCEGWQFLAVSGVDSVVQGNYSAVSRGGLLLIKRLLECEDVVRLLAFFGCPSCLGVKISVKSPMFSDQALLLKVHRGAADSVCLEVHGHLDTVCDLDEGNATVHPVILTVEGHCPFDRA